MKFEEALLKIRNGGRMTRPRWGKMFLFIDCDSIKLNIIYANEIKPFQIGIGPDGTMTLQSFLEADDWIVIPQSTAKPLTQLAEGLGNHKYAYLENLKNARDYFFENIERYCKVGILDSTKVKIIFEQAFPALYDEVD